MNPILDPKYFIPDVEARVYDGKLYLYGSLDICGNDDYCSHNYYVFETEDLKNFKVYPNTFNSSLVPDEESKNSILFAPDLEKIGGKYCLFYCQSDRSEGVAFADSPVGPFGNAQEIDVYGIDPSVFVDDDGSVYYFWGQINGQAAKLNPETFQIIPETHVDGVITEAEHGFHEGMSVRKKGDLYYLVYTDISRGRPTALGYATSKHPLGPYTKRGIIIDNIGCDPQTWNDHGCIAEFNGKWYVFYHRSSHNGYFSRRCCVEPITFNEDGTISEVEMTTQGIDGPIPCFTKVEAFRTSRINGRAYIDDYADHTGRYDYIKGLANGESVEYKYIDFTEEAASITVESAGNASSINVYLDHELTPIATIRTEKTAGKYLFMPFSAKLGKKISGKHMLRLEVRGGEDISVNLKSFVFGE